MPPKTVPSTDGSTSRFTPREQELLCLAYQHYESEPKLNTTKFAESAGFTNPGSAVNAWAKIKKKLCFSQANANAATPGSKQAATNGVGKATGKKRAAPVDDQDDAADPYNMTPTGKRGRKKTKAVKVEQDDGSDEADGGAEEVEVDKVKDEANDEASEKEE